MSEPIVSALLARVLVLRAALLQVLGELEGEFGHAPSVGMPMSKLTPGMLQAREALGLEEDEELPNA